MSTLFLRLLRNRWIPPLNRIQRFHSDPASTQEQVLRQLLRKAAHTEWGNRYDFASLLGHSDIMRAYRERVPLHRYDDFQPAIQRMYQGETDVLWPGRVMRYAVSGGTAGSSKLFPAPPARLRSNRDQVAAAVLHYLSETGDFEGVRGSRIALTGYVQEDPGAPGVSRGEISGLAAEAAFRARGLISAFARRRALPESILRITDWDRKLNAIVDYGIDRDIRLLGIMPTWGLELFERLVERYNARHGTSVETIGEIWPKLAVIFTGGVPLRTYLPALKAKVGLSHVKFIEMYGATEAPIAFQSSLDDSSLLLNGNNGVFFEFIDRSELARGDPKRYHVGEIQTGKSYIPVLTTCGGLWSYMLDDVVRFTQISPPKLTIVGRESEILDTVGEFLEGEQCRSALLRASEATGNPVTACHIAPYPHGHKNGNQHQWLIEFDHHPIDAEEFAKLLDQQLQKENESYRIWRTALKFGPPVVTPLPKGRFRLWMNDSRTNWGAQTKVPLMAQNRDIADAVLRL